MSKKASNPTLYYRSLAIVLDVLAALLLFGPVLGYGIAGLIIGTTVAKFVMGSMFVVAIIMTIMGLLMKLKFRCIIFLLLIGIHACLANIMSLLIVFAVTSIIEEIFVTPAAKKMHEAARTNALMDQRGVGEGN